MVTARKDDFNVTNTIMVHTACGVEPLASGIIYTHEHVWLDIRTETDCGAVINDIDSVVEELRHLRQKGLGALIELSCRGMGRDVRRFADIQLRSGVQIIPATGYYYQRFHPAFLGGADVDTIVNSLIEDLETGMDDTGVTPMILGEIGGSNPLTPQETRVFRAVAKVARVFPVVVMTHAHLGQSGLEELDVLVRQGVHPSRIAIGHMDLADNFEHVKEIAQRGAYVGMDTIGKEGYAPDHRRRDTILRLIEMGYGDQLLLSCDISRNAYLSRNGGHGYSHLLDRFVPSLREAGLCIGQINHLLSENPRRFLHQAMS